MNLRRTVTTVAALAIAAAGLVTLTPTASADLAAPTSTSARHLERHPFPLPRLIDIRTGRHAAYDRIVFDLRGAPPGYDVRYVSTVRQDASGHPVRMMGRAYLQVRLLSAQAHSDTGRATYTGPTRAWVGFPTLRGFVVNGDFEGIVSIALGLSKRAGFRVFTLTKPTRIVVDVAH